MRKRILRALCLCLALTTSLAAEEKKGSDELYQNLDLFTKVFHYVQGDYVEKVSEKDLLFGAIRGMLATLDPHSAFLPPEIYEELKVDTEGRFGGVGIEITVKENMLTVVSPIEGTPADRAGIREGDKIFKINGTPTKEMPLAEAVRAMRGRRGSKITLTLLREGVKEPFDVTLSRDIIRIKSVRWETPEEGYGYVRITSFQEGTHNELVKALQTLAKKANPLKGLVLDLRNNPGGLLDEAVSIADQFLKQGTIVTTQSRDKEIDKREAREDGSEPDYPIIALINGGSASAAEIVAGALQDHSRAVILGTPSFGKGSVQTIYELGRGSALKLTVARYYTPKGRSIQVEGIHPDVLVETREAAEAIKIRERFVREKDLARHLSKEKTQRSETETPSKTTEDFQKVAALNYLKSWDVFSKPHAGVPE